MYRIEIPKFKKKKETPNKNPNKLIRLRFIILDPI